MLKERTLRSIKGNLKSFKSSLFVTVTKIKICSDQLPIPNSLPETYHKDG